MTSTPHPTFSVEISELPSPARGEGTITQASSDGIPAGREPVPTLFVESRCDCVTASGECHGSTSAMEGLSEAFAGFVPGCALFRDFHEPAHPLQHHQ